MLKDVFLLYIARRDFFLALSLEHLGISALSIGLAFVIGLLLGIFVSEYQRSSPFILGMVNFVYTIPSISLLGFLIPFSGIGNTTAIIALTVYALLPMVRNTHAGITSIDPTIIEAAQGMGSTRLQMLYKIKLPLAFIAIISGLRNTVVMTIALAGIASFIGAGGLGVAIYRGITTNNSAMVVAGSLLIAIMAMGFDFVLGYLETHIRKKRRLITMKKRSWKTAALFLCCLGLTASFFACSNEQSTIKIATKPMTEQFILGDMLTMLIEQDTDLKVVMTQGVGGGTGNIQPALLKGDFDLYPEYTGTAWSYVLKKEGISDDATMLAVLMDEYKTQFNLEWVGLYGFNNTYGLVVRKEIADKHHLQTYSDLAAVAPELVFGAEYDFYEREDGYTALCETYGYNFKRQVDLDIGLKYQAINSGEIDVMNIFTTDGQLSVSDVTILEDDKHFYQTYYCGTIVRQDTLEKFPALRASLMKMNGLLSDAEMAALNYQVEGKGRDSKAVAREFLQAKGLLR